MSTSYTLYDKGALLIELEERSSRVSLSIDGGFNTTMDGRPYAYTPTLLDTNDLIQMCVRMAEVAAYVAYDPAKVRSDIINALNNSMAF